MNNAQLPRLPWHASAFTRLEPAAQIYLGAAIAASLVLLPTFALDFYWQALVLALLLLGIGLLRMWLVPLLLTLVMINYLITEAPLTLGTNLVLVDLIVAVSVLTAVVASSRYVVLSAAAVPYYRGSLWSRLTIPLTRLFQRWRSPLPRGIPPRDSRAFRGGELATGAARIVAAVVIAATLLSLFPLDPRSAGRTGIIPPASRAIELGSVLVIVAIAICLFVAGAAWQSLTPRQARMFLRGEATGAHQADLVRMARYQSRKHKS